MNVLAVIPARYGSTRFPAKCLARKTGKFLVQHVYEQVRRATRIGVCLIATDDDRVVQAVRSFGGEAVMTRSDHQSGTDRIAEVVAARGGQPDDIIVNVQGDEPEIEPAYLDRLIGRLETDREAPLATLACPFPPLSDPNDPNCVKVVQNRLSRALYFSRALIPYPRDSAGQPKGENWLLHLGVYAYRRAFLLEFASWSAGLLEQVERLEQLRVLEFGYPIALERVETASAGIDTPDDYERFVQRFRSCGGRQACGSGAC